MAKKDPDMSREFISIRSLIDKKSSQTLTDWADEEGRSQQMHTGILLRRLCILFQDPKKQEQLRQLGLLNPLVNAHAA